MQSQKRSLMLTKSCSGSSSSSGFTNTILWTMQPDLLKKLAANTYKWFYYIYILQVSLKYKPFWNYHAVLSNVNKIYVISITKEKKCLFSLSEEHIQSKTCFCTGIFYVIRGTAVAAIYWKQRRCTKIRVGC